MKLDASKLERRGEGDVHGLERELGSRGACLFLLHSFLLPPGE